MHARKPLTKAMKEDITKAASAGDSGKVNDVKDEDSKEEEVKQEEEKEGEQNGGERAEKDDGERDKESKRDVTLKERTGDVTRDWRRNGTLFSVNLPVCEILAIYLFVKKMIVGLTGWIPRSRF